MTLDSTRSGNGRTWSVASSTDGLVFTLNPERIEALLKGCSELLTTRFVQYSGEFPPSYGLTPPRLSIRVDLEDGSRPRTSSWEPLPPKGNSWRRPKRRRAGRSSSWPNLSWSSWLRPPRNRDDLPENVFAP